MDGNSLSVQQHQELLPHQGDPTETKRKLNCHQVIVIDVIDRQKWRNSEAKLILENSVLENMLNLHTHLVSRFSSLSRGARWSRQTLSNIHSNQLNDPL